MTLSRSIELNLREAGRVRAGAARDGLPPVRGRREWGTGGVPVNAACDADGRVSISSLADAVHARPFPSQTLDRLAANLEGEGPIIHGYGSRFGVGYVMADSFGPYLEVMAADAFTGLDRPDFEASLLIGHKGLGLATVTSGRMRLQADDYGLGFAARLNPNEASARELAERLASGSATTEASVGGFIGEAVWDGDYTTLTVREWVMHRGEISVVNAGANPGAWAALRETRVAEDVVTTEAAKVAAVSEVDSLLWAINTTRKR